MVAQTIMDKNDGTLWHKCSKILRQIRGLPKSLPPLINVVPTQRYSKFKEIQLTLNGGAGVLSRVFLSRIV